MNKPTCGFAVAAAVLAGAASVFAEGDDPVVVEEGSRVEVQSGTFEVRALVPHRYYRFQAVASEAGVAQLEEIDFYDGSGNMVRKDNVTVTGVNWYGDHTPLCAYDGVRQNRNNKWLATNLPDSYVQLDFGDEPVQIASYVWYTAGDFLNPGQDGGCRTLSAWKILCSDDGQEWMLLHDVQLENPAVVGRGDWPTDRYYIPASITRIANKDLVVDEGAGVELISAAATLKSLENRGDVVLSGTGSSVSVGTGADVLPVLKGGIGGVGDFIKTGYSVQEMTGVNTYVGDTIIREGELIVADAFLPCSYFRFRLKNAWGQVPAFKRLALYDAAGGIPSDGLQVTVGTPADELEPGYFSIPDYSRPNNNVYGGYNDAWVYNIFQNNDDKWLFDHSWNGFAEAVVTIRLPENSGRIVRYDLRSEGECYPERSLKNWTLEGSPDGVNWQTLDEQVDSARIPDNWERGLWYGQTLHGHSYALADYAVDSTTDEATIPAGSTVEIAPGAKLTVRTAMTISGLRLDVDATENAVVDGLNMAPNGKLYLVGEAETLTVPCVLPLTIGNLGAVQDWTVYYNGVRAKLAFRPAEGAGTSTVVDRLGLCVIVR